MGTSTTSAIREPLTYALGTRGKVACLKLLSLIKEPVTQREVARRANLQHRTIQLSLDELVQIGVVKRLEGGRDYLVQLNRDHRLAPAIERLFREEADHFLELRRSLVELASGGKRGEVASLVVFGSSARAEDTATSDLDVLLITPDEPAREAALQRFESAREALRMCFGVELRFIGYSKAEARRLWQLRRAPITEIRREGIVLLGPPLEEALDGQR